MSSSKSIFGPALLGVALTGATGAFLYLLLKKDEEEYYETSKSVSSRQVALEVRIPKDSVGVVIGRQGANIRDIQAKTDTRINFKDELETDTHRVACIRGLPDDAQMAEILIHQTIASQPRLETLELFVPNRSIGRIIGRNGDTIRALQRNARCKIDVERGGDERDPDGKKRITIKGTSHQIDLAKSMVEEKVAEEETMRQKHDLQANRPARIKYKQPLFLKCESEDDDGPPSLKGEEEELVPTGTDPVLEVYVSAVATPSSFWVQKIGPLATALDKLEADMTVYYESQTNQSFHTLTRVEPGDIVVAVFTGDSKYYRARVVNFKLDEYDETKSKVDLDFVDYGDCEEKEIGEIFEIRPDYLKLKFQAIQCTLAHVKPAGCDGSSWSPESVDQFEILTHCAQWKVVWAKIVKNLSGSPPSVELIDTSAAGCDVNIGQELVRRGLASVAETDTDTAIGTTRHH